MTETEGPSSKQPPLLGLATPSEFPPALFLIPQQSTGTLPGQSAVGPSGEAREGTAPQGFGPKSDLDGSAAPFPRPYRALACPAPPDPARRAAAAVRPLHVPADPPPPWPGTPLSATGLHRLGSRARALPAPPAPSSEPGRRPLRGPRPGRAGSLGGAGGRSSAEGTALGPPA